MELKDLGKSGIKVPEIGLGTGSSRRVEALRLGIELGAYLIDTAESYSTEGLVGEAIKGQRDRVFLATKVSPSHFRYDDVLKAAENSLRRLDTSFIDLYQLHWPSSTIPISETMRAMETLVRQGRVKHIGVSNFSIEQTEEARKALSREEIVSNQVEYNLLNREIEKGLLPYCEAQGITVIAYSPLARGDVVGRSKRSRNLASTLELVAKAQRKTIAQVALNWIATHKRVVVIPKADKLEHVRENCGASGWRLSKEDYDLVDEASR